MKRFVSSMIDDALDAAQVTPAQRTTIHQARDRAFAAVEAHRQDRAGSAWSRGSRSSKATGSTRRRCTSSCSSASRSTARVADAIGQALHRRPRRADAGPAEGASPTTSGRHARASHGLIPFGAGCPCARPRSSWTTTPGWPGLVKEYLGRHEIDVTVAVDGERGLAAVRRGRFNVVLLDLMLPRCRRPRAVPAIRARRARRPPRS